MTAPTPPARPWWARFTDALRYIAKLQPAYVAALWRALAAVLGAIGLSVTDAVDARVLAAIVAVYALIELVTSKQVHNRVVPTAKLPDDLVAEAAAGPLPGSPAETIAYPPAGGAPPSSSAYPPA